MSDVHDYSLVHVRCIVQRDLRVHVQKTLCFVKQRVVSYCVLAPLQSYCKVLASGPGHMSEVHVFAYVLDQSTVRFQLTFCGCSYFAQSK